MSRWPPPDAALGTVQGLSQRAAAKLAALGYVGAVSTELPPPEDRPDPKDIYPIHNDLQRKSPRVICDMALQLLLPRSATDIDRRRGLILARAALAKRASDAAYQAAVGMALYRLGRHADALQALQRAGLMWQRDELEPDPEMLAFLAMTRKRLGHADQAREALDALRERLAFSDDSRSRLLLAEAEAVLAEP